MYPPIAGIILALLASCALTPCWLPSQLCALLCLSPALQIAATIGQPAGTAIYFAVDYDATTADIGGPIADYFTAVNAALDAASTRYTAGVYGSGLTCRAMRKAGLATFTWLAGFTGFQQYKNFLPQADIVQLTPERAIVAGLTIDDDIAQKPAFGAFRLP